MFARAGALVLLLVVSACSSGAELIVEVRTDWVPGVEFGGVSIQLDSEPAVADVAAFVTDDYAAGISVATFRDLEAGTHHLIVTLRQASGEVLDEASVRVNLAEDESRAVTVVLARSAQVCAGASDCTATVTCAEGACVDGVCLIMPVADRCAADEYCDPTDGCTETPTDAGVLDAGGGADSGVEPLPDTGLSCSGTPVLWNRATEWTPGPTHESSEGNPSADGMGRPTWHYEWTTGGPLGDAAVWYGESPTPLVWDDSWFGEDPGWARGDDVNPVVMIDSITHNAGPSHFDFVPRIRWANPTGAPVMLTVYGRFEIYWAGISEATSAAVDLVIARLDGGGAALEEVVAMRVDKPTADTSFEDTRITVSPTVTMVDADESIAVSVRAHGGAYGNWIILRDDLTYSGVPCTP